VPFPPLTISLAKVAVVCSVPPMEISLLLIITAALSGDSQFLAGSLALKTSPSLSSVMYPSATTLLKKLSAIRTGCSILHELVQSTACVIIVTDRVKFLVPCCGLSLDGGPAVPKSAKSQSYDSIYSQLIKLGHLVESPNELTFTCTSLVPVCNFCTGVVSSLPNHMVVPVEAHLCLNKLKRISINVVDYRISDSHHLLGHYCCDINLSCSSPKKSDLTREALAVLSKSDHYLSDSQLLVKVPFVEPPCPVCQSPLWYVAPSF
jgi:hypothetical protein